MSGKHSTADRWGRKTDADGNVVNMSGDLDDTTRDRPYNETRETNR